MVGVATGSLQHAPQVRIACFCNTVCESVVFPHKGLLNTSTFTKEGERGGGAR